MGSPVLSGVAAQWLLSFPQPGLGCYGDWVVVLLHWADTVVRYPFVCLVSSPMHLFSQK